MKSGEELEAQSCDPTLCRKLQSSSGRQVYGVTGRSGKVPLFWRKLFCCVWDRLPAVGSGVQSYDLAAYDLWCPRCRPTHTTHYKLHTLHTTVPEPPSHLFRPNASLLSAALSRLHESCSPGRLPGATVACASPSFFLSGVPVFPSVFVHVVSAFPPCSFVAMARFCSRPGCRVRVSAPRRKAGLTTCAQHGPPLAIGSPRIGRARLFCQFPQCGARLSGCMRCAEHRGPLPKRLNTRLRGRLQASSAAAALAACQTIRSTASSGCYAAALPLQLANLALQVPGIPP